MNTPYATVRPVRDVDRQAVLDVLTEAFMDDPLTCWIFPEKGERRRLQSRFHGLHLTAPDAEAYLIGDNEGAALWRTFTAAPGDDPEAPASNSRLHALGQALAPRHPHGEPHLYLACMGVTGGRRGAGLGTALLRHRLERADADGLGVYLEASSTRSRALYLRHGFTDLGEPVRVADSPPLWPMWRGAKKEGELY